MNSLDVVYRSPAYIIIHKFILIKFIQFVNGSISHAVRLQTDNNYLLKFHVAN